jgi:hypothetical protein
MKSVLLGILLVAAIGSSVAAFLFYQDKQKLTAILETPPVDTSAVTLPEDAVKISECVPFEGEHYVQPSKLPDGPFYVAYEGKVSAVEFMFTPDRIPNEKGAKMDPKEAMEMIQKNKLSLADLVLVHNFEFDLMNLRYKSITLTWASPHSGLTKPHYDLHLFFVDKAEAKSICPDSKLEDVYSQEVMDNIQKYKIPFPASL